MNLKSCLRTIITTAPLLLSTVAYASECNDLAPLADLENTENGYFNVLGRDLTNENRSRLKKFSDALNGKWHGTELVKTCVGHHKSPISERSRYKVHADITRHATGAIRMDAEKERLSDRAIKLDTLFLSPESDSNYGRELGWHTLEFIDGNTLIYSEKSRVRSGNNFSRIMHEIKKIELVENKLTVDRKLYVNGAFVEQTAWILNR